MSIHLLGHLFLSLFLILTVSVLHTRQRIIFSYEAYPGSWPGSSLHHPPLPLCRLQVGRFDSAPPRRPRTERWRTSGTSLDVLRWRDAARGAGGGAWLRATAGRRGALFGHQLQGSRWRKGSGKVLKCINKVWSWIIWGPADTGRTSLDVRIVQTSAKVQKKPWEEKRQRILLNSWQNSRTLKLQLLFQVKSGNKFE